MKRNISCFLYRAGCLPRTIHYPISQMPKTYNLNIPCTVITGNSKKHFNKSYYNYPHERTLFNKITLVNQPPSKRTIHSNLLVYYNIYIRLSNIM